MTNEPYSDLVRQLFADLVHAGDLAEAQHVQVDDQGLRIALAARCDDGVLEAVRFRAWGCPHVLAATESFCRDYEGRPCSDLLDFRAADVMQTLPVPTEKLGRILVLEDAVRSLGQSVLHDLDGEPE
jgi:NifU-like protein involved in Fe-S cluster formation